MDVSKKAPTPRPEDLPLLKRPSSSAPNDDDDDDSDGDQYPKDRGYVPPKQNSAILPDKSAIDKPAAQVSVSEPSAPIPDEPIESTTAKPAAQNPSSEPTASGTNARTKLNAMEMISSPFTPLSPTTNQACSEDEVSLGDVPEPMGSQISVPETDQDIRMSDTIAEDPLEFATSYLMLYSIPATEDFTTVQSLVTTIASRLNVTVRHLVRVTADWSHNFWFEMMSVEQA